VSAVVLDPFARVFGSERGRAQRECGADLEGGELDRLMRHAVAFNFAEPLAALRVYADALNCQPPSLADVLCMCVSTQMVNYQDRICLSVAAALG
jgi:hypothetical protein